eukprot:SAG11_NODE_25639_length_356_cov_0.607004_1_plen_66_part_00
MRVVEPAAESRRRLQKHIVRILLMPPVYAIDCFACMRFESLGLYLTLIRGELNYRFEIVSGIDAS